MGTALKVALCYTFAPRSAYNYGIRLVFVFSMHRDLVEVDALILEIADYKNDYAAIAAEKLWRRCSTSWDAYQYLQDRAHDMSLPDSARQQLRRIIKRIQVQIHQCREYGYAYEPS